MTWTRIAAIVVCVALVGLLGGWLYFQWVANPRVTRTLLEDPGGELAGRVMLLALPSGRRIPVNYTREGEHVYAAADGRWWRELVGAGAPVSVLVRGETLRGRARAVRDDPGYRRRVFAKLRPTALPGFGTLVEIRIDPDPTDSE